LVVRFLGNLAPPSPSSVWMKGLLYAKHGLCLFNTQKIKKVPNCRNVLFTRLAVTLKTMNYIGDNMQE